jgi:hypothetical protein
MQEIMQRILIAFNIIFSIAWLGILYQYNSTQAKLNSETAFLFNSIRNSLSVSSSEKLQIITKELLERTELIENAQNRLVIILVSVAAFQAIANSVFVFQLSKAKP